MTKLEIAAHGRAYRLKNKASIAARNKDYRLKNKETIAARNRIYQQANKTEIAAKQRIYNKANKIKMAATRRIYQQANRPRINARFSDRLKTDANFRANHFLRGRMKDALRRNQKTGIAVSELGCTGPELRVYLESLFETGMSWSNYGVGKNQWSIDHIVPLASVDLTNREEFLKVCHYTNLQPMWHSLNLAKRFKI